MATEKDLGLLDDYISNRLPIKDKLAFEQKMASDFELTKQYNLQQGIVSGIRNARAAELKSMLNNVTVAGHTSGSSAIIKVAALAITAGLVTTGIYFYFNQDNTATQNTTLDLPVQEEPSPETNNVPPAAQANDQQNDHEKRENKEIPAQAHEQSSPLPESTKPSVSAYDPSEDAAEENNNSIDDSNITASAESPEPTIKVETDKTNEKYNFHYQLKDDQLVLYGSFEKNLYEVMEFFHENKRTVFLFYKNNYYLLNEENDKIKALSPINDPALLKKLRDYRAK